MHDRDFNCYQLVGPLADFAVRWEIYEAKDREKARNWLARYYESEPKTLAAVEAFLDALDEARR